MKKHSLSLPLFLLIIPLMTGCTLFNKNNNTNNNSGDNNNSGTPSSIYRIDNPDYSFVQRNTVDEVTYEDLFNLNNKVEITIDVDKAEMQKINDDNVYAGQFDSIKPETYHLAKKFTLVLHNGNKEFKWELENVGIKQKGNTSRKPIFKDNGDISNQNHFKISFGETFTDTERYDAAFISAHGNEEYKDREILGLDGLDIKWNKVDDSTHLKEIYSNMILRSAGILAQHIGLATMEMKYDGNKTANFGLCSIYEPSNKSFVKRSLQSTTSYINMPTWKNEKEGTHGVAGKKYGDLYKCSYGKGDGASSGANFTADSITGKKLGVKTDIAGYNWPTYERKTNTGETYNDQQMRDLVSLLNNSSATISQIGEKVDLQYLAMEEAVMYFLGSPDAMRYNYNNYMAYFRRTDGKLVIIPIDNDRCFGVGNGWTDGMNFIIGDSAKPMASTAVGGSQKNPLLLKTIFASGDNQVKTDYQACLNLVKNSVWLKNETFERFYNLLKTTYTGLSTFSLDGGDDNISFSSYMQKKLALAGGASSSSDSNQSGNNNENNNNNQTQTPIFPLDAELFVTGSFTKWGTATDLVDGDYRLRFEGDNLLCIFKVKMEIEGLPGFTLKIWGGSTQQWTYDFGVEENNPSVFVERGRNIERGDVQVGDIVRFSVNIYTGSYTLEVAERESSFANWNTFFALTDLHNGYALQQFTYSSSENKVTLDLTFDAQYVSQEMNYSLFFYDGNYYYGLNSSNALTFCGAYSNDAVTVLQKSAGQAGINIQINTSTGVMAIS